MAEDQTEELRPSWWVYVLTSRAGRTYVGATIDPKRRLLQHNGKQPGGAAHTRSGRPWRIRRLHGPFSGRSAAQRIEAQVKRLRGRSRVDWAPPELPPGHAPIR
jgi:predicted GIY-YIG superfamily endonuclease